MSVAPYAGIPAGPGTETVALSVIGDGDGAGDALLVLVGANAALTLKSPGAGIVTALPSAGTRSSPVTNPGVVVGAGLAVTGFCNCGSWPAGIELPPAVFAHAARTPHANAKTAVFIRRIVSPLDAPDGES